ncbi:hypothetical protein BDV36DRAFT_243745, partial [Aspergillus pseudocaelatus]
MLTSTCRSYLSIPPVKWYQARSLGHERMSHVYEVKGSLIFGVCGRRNWCVA